ncbi:MAG: sensor histidine kinase [Blautia sp.]|nr:sensor histidine kinase [Blautia sp.]
MVQKILVKYYEDDIIRNACIGVSSMIDVNSRKLNEILENIETTAQLMINDEYYYDVFSKIPNYKVSDYLQVDRKIGEKTYKKFIYQPEVYDAYFYVPGWTLGVHHADNANIVMAMGFDTTAHQAKGAAKWITGYDYGETVKSDYLIKKEEYPYRYLLTMVKEMNFQYASRGSYYHLQNLEELPVLIVHVKESSIRNTYADTLGYEDIRYFIFNGDRKIVSSATEEFEVSKNVPDELFLYYGSTGFDIASYKGQELLLCYNTLNNRNLCSLAMIPLQTLVYNTVSGMRDLWRTLAVFIIVLSIAASVVFSRSLFKPIRMLMKASERVGQGNFSADTPLPWLKEFRILTQSFNDMEKKISKLIYENYEISLKEKESQLMVLSLQINPHFLYNTLNVINLSAIKNEDPETSEMIISLSEMLQYTTRNSSEKGALEDEIDWTSNYLYIMSRRFQNRFYTEIDIDEDLMNARIPRLLFQPFLENAIIHGFSEESHKGVLKLKINQEEGFLHIMISDNGKGMDKQEDYMNISHQEGHIGISNVVRRLKLIYGNDYCFRLESKAGEGTRVTIVIPYEEICEKSNY